MVNYGHCTGLVGLLAVMLAARRNSLEISYRVKEMPLLFSYGTLQQENVQLSTFGRLLTGQPDALLGYQMQMVRIEDAEVVALSGKTHHPIVVFNGDLTSQVAGSVFEVTDAELLHADAYEVDAYQRVLADLASGKQAWVYVST